MGRHAAINDIVSVAARRNRLVPNRDNINGPGDKQSHSVHASVGTSFPQPTFNVTYRRVAELFGTPKSATSLSRSSSAVQKFRCRPRIRTGDGASRVRLATLPSMYISRYPASQVDWTSSWRSAVNSD